MSSTSNRPVALLESLDQLKRETLFVLRSLFHARGFTAAVVLTLALGIGLTASIIDLSSWILFRSNPYPAAEQLYVIGLKDRRGAFKSYRYGFDLQAFQEQTQVFSQYAAVNRDTTNVIVEGVPSSASMARISADTFACFGVRPRLGRPFVADEYRPGANNVVVLSDAFWRRELQSDPNVIGRDLQIGEQICEVVGVLAPNQTLPPYFVADVYQPLVVSFDPMSPFTPILFIIGRLQEGITPHQATAALNQVQVSLSPIAAEYVADESVEINSLKFAAYRREVYWIMFVSGIFLFGISGLNAANLFLVRVMGRRREISVRLALGGTHAQLARLLTVECFVLALIAAVVGAIGAYVCTPLVFAQLETAAGVTQPSYTWSWSVTYFAAGLALVAGVGMAMIGVVQTWKPNILAGLVAGGKIMGDSGKMRKVRDILVLLQAALAIVLLSGAGLMMRTMQELQSVDLGFRPVDKVKVGISLPPDYKLSNEARIQMMERLSERFSRIVSVTGVSYGSDALLSGAFIGMNRIRMPDGTKVPVQSDLVASDFDEVAGLTLKRGRWVGDNLWPLEAVINESFARVRFGDVDPIGQEIKMSNDMSADVPLQVVGVVKDVRETVRSTAGYHVYMASRLFPPGLSTLIVATNRYDPALSGLIRRAVREVDPKIVISTIEPYEQLLLTSLTAERRTLAVLRAVSVVAVLLAMLGVYAFMSYTVDRRMNEFGVRLALGASSSQLVGLVMKRGLLLVAGGVLVGTLASVALTRFLESLLYGTTPYDPLVLLAVAVVLLVVAAVGCCIPAFRAGGANISSLLRSS